jgi:hypothetical protein
VVPKKFYTERDIEDLFSSGVRSLEIRDDVVLTDLAYEKAGSLGFKLVQPGQLPPSAPVRPYISKNNESSHPAPASAGKIDEVLRQRVRQAVAARLGNQVDPALLDTIIQRVLLSTKL